MTQTLRIAEVARRSGFSASALRYYEEIGLLPPPERTTAGYRAYGDDVLSRLSFIARAKRLGCTLDEISDLMDAWDTQRCRPVQARLEALVRSKVADTQVRIAELSAFAAQLQRVAASLGHHTPDGPCDDECGCAATPPGIARTSVGLTDKPTAGAFPIACTLDAAAMPGRVQAWQNLLALASQRESIDGGVRITFDPAADAAAIAELAATEQQCCAFFAFAVTVDHRGIALEVRGPDDAVDLVHGLFGTAA